MSDQPDQHDQPEPYFNVRDIIIDDEDDYKKYMGTVTYVQPAYRSYIYQYTCTHSTDKLKGSNTIWIRVNPYTKFGAEHLLEKVGREADEFGEGGESQWPQEGIEVVAQSES